MANLIILLVSLLFTATLHLSATGQICDERNTTLIEEGRGCRKQCQTDADCIGTLKRCLCDDICGLSCFNPNARCEDPEIFENGFIEGEDRTYNNVITYHCNNRYTPVGTATRRCRSDKKWSGSTPFCEGICTAQGFASAFPDSSQSEFEVGERLQLGCRTGYIPIAEELFVTCQAGGTWNESEIPCLLVDCGHPRSPQNGLLVGDIFTFGSQVHFVCNTGFEINAIYNQNFISCTSSGNWVGAIPIADVPTACTRVQCTQPIAPEHGSINTDGLVLEYGTRITYSCDFGFQIRGNPEGICNENSTWGELPTCVVYNDCDFENRLQPTCFYNNNGWQRTFINDGLLNNFGYTLHSSQNSESRLTSQTIRSPLICVSFYYRVEAQLELLDFFIQNTHSNESRLWSIELESQSEWVGALVEIPSTNEIIQFELVARSPAPSVVEIDDIKVNYSACDKQCDSNPCANGATCLNLLDDYRCKCTQTFIGRNCLEEITCEVQEAPQFGYTDSSVARVGIGERVRYRCNGGYGIRGNAFLTCKSDGTWQGRFPKCNELACPGGYTYSFPYCFRLSTDLQTHSNADASCRNDGATLAKVVVAESSIVAHAPMVNTITNFLKNNGGVGFYWTGARILGTSCEVRAVSLNFQGSIIDTWLIQNCNSRYRYLCMTWASQVTPIELSSSLAAVNGNYLPLYGFIVNGRPLYSRGGTSRISYASGYWEVNWAFGFSTATTTALTPQKITENWSNNLQPVIETFQRWTSWSTWSLCSASCDRGTYFRTRSCSQPSLETPNCQGPSRQIRNCFIQSCEIELNSCDSSPCLNEGTCVEVSDGYTCTCPMFTTGNQCETKLNSCDSSPCLNEGTCVEVSDGYTCTCPMFTTGNQCETRTCAISTSLIQEGVVIVGANDADEYLEGQSLNITCENSDRVLNYFGDPKVVCGPHNIWTPPYRFLRCL